MASQSKPQDTKPQPRIVAGGHIKAGKVVSYAGGIIRGKRS